MHTCRSHDGVDGGQQLLCMAALQGLVQAADNLCSPFTSAAQSDAESRTCRIEC
jgi:hypothetical protein